LNGAPDDRAAWPGVARVPVLVVPQFTPAEVPGCPVAKTAPAEGSNRQAPIAREANTCFISALPFKTMLRIETVVWRITSSALANALTCALTVAVQAMGLDRCQQNTGRAQNIPNYPDFFEPPPSCRSIFSDCAGPNSARGIGVKRCALRKSAAGRGGATSANKTC